jgi:hypothetical protein
MSKTNSNCDVSDISLAKRKRDAQQGQANASASKERGTEPCPGTESSVDCQRSTLRLGRKETTSKYGGQQRIHSLNTRGQPKRDGL